MREVFCRHCGNWVDRLLDGHCDDCVVATDRGGRWDDDRMADYVGSL